MCLKILECFEMLVEECVELEKLDINSQEIFSLLLVLLTAEFCQSHFFFT